MGTEGIQDRYVNPYTDFGFKLLFGTAMNKELLISFLNAFLFGEKVIKDVTYLDAEHLGIQEYDRQAVLMYTVKTRMVRSSLSKCSVGSSSFSRTSTFSIPFFLSVNRQGRASGIMSCCLRGRYSEFLL